MRLCMFHPNGRPMERGWAGRIDGETVVHLAAQSLQHFLSGGARAREHAEYPLGGVTLLAPVLHPPAVRVFARADEFEFANPTAILSPGVHVSHPRGHGRLTVCPRLAGVVGADGAIGGFTAALEFRAPGLTHPKDRDFAIVLGPVVVTPDELLGGPLSGQIRVAGAVRASGSLSDVDWEAARSTAAAGTVLRIGDLLVGPPLEEVDDLAREALVEFSIDQIGTLQAVVA